MSEYMIIDGCPQGLKQGLEDYWWGKRQRFNAMLKRVPEDQRSLRLSFRRNPPEMFEAHAVLRLPTGTLVANFSAPDAYRAVDGVTDVMEEEVRRHMSRLHEKPVGLKEETVRSTAP